MPADVQCSADPVAIILTRAAAAAPALDFVATAAS
jgi:hypothetical protein